MPDIRLARPADLPAVSQLAAWVWLQTYADGGVRPAFLDYLTATFGTEALATWLSPGHRCWLALEGEELLGFLHARLDRPFPVPAPCLGEGPAEVCQLYVAPVAARRGIGRVLMDTVRDALPDRALWLSVWALNERALAFYEAQQGRRLGETWFELEQQRHPNWIYGWPARQPAHGATDDLRHRH